MDTVFISSLKSKFEKEGFDHADIPAWNDSRRKFLESNIAAVLMIAARKCPYLARLTNIAVCKDNMIELHYRKYHSALSMKEWSFEAYLKSNPKVSRIQLIIDLICNMSDALITLHNLDIVHRDIKPSNYIIDSTNYNPITTIKLTDLELAHRLGAINSDFGRAAGTEGYAAPEQYSTRTILATKIDQYPLALTLIYILTSGKINPEESNSGLFVMDEEKEKLLQQMIGMRALKILRKAISIAPENRFQSVHQFRCSLIAAIAQHFRNEA